MRRNKFRFLKFFRVQLWWRLYYDEFHASRYAYREEGYSLYDSEDEAVRAFNRQRRNATQYANEVVGRI